MSNSRKFTLAALSILSERGELCGPDLFAAINARLKTQRSRASSRNIMQGLARRSYVEITERQSDAKNEGGIYYTLTDAGHLRLSEGITPQPA